MELQKVKNNIAIILVLSIFVPNHNAFADKLDNHINSQVNNLVGLLVDSYASEYPAARKIKFHQLGETTKIVSVLFTLESFALGNNYSQYLAIFSKLSSPKPGKIDHYSLLDVLQVGGKAWRTVEDVKMRYDQKISKYIVSLQTLEIKEGDCINCFSIPSKAIYSINPRKGGRLSLISGSFNATAN